MECKDINNIAVATKCLGDSAIQLLEALSNFAKALCSREIFKIAMGNIDSHNGKYCDRKAYKKARFKKMYKRRYEKVLRRFK
mgnify:CR=1 FL=1